MATNFQSVSVLEMEWRHVIDSDFISGNYDVMMDFEELPKLTRLYLFYLDEANQIFKNTATVTYLWTNAESTVKTKNMFMTSFG